MNKLLGLIAIILLLGCAPSGNRNNSDSPPVSGKSECDKSVPFGDIDVCLPMIDGMIECYSLPIVKNLADRTEYKGNSVLAFYLNNAVYEQVDKLMDIIFDDYFTIYVVNGLKGVKAGQTELNRMANMMESNYLKKNWDDIKQKTEKTIKFASVGKPVLMESYSPHKDVRTEVMLVKYQMEGYENVVLMTINFILIKERMIGIAYYKGYDGPKSVSDAKSKNDYIVLTLVDENKN